MLKNTNCINSKENLLEFEGEKRGEKPPIPLHKLGFQSLNYGLNSPKNVLNLSIYTNLIDKVSFKSIKPRKQRPFGEQNTTGTSTSLWTTLARRTGHHARRAALARRTGGVARRAQASSAEFFTLLASFGERSSLFGRGILYITLAIFCTLFGLS